MAKWIISHFPPHRVYVEPFGGAASVLLRKPRSYAEVYNDMDDEVVNVFRVLREPESRDRLVEALELTPFARTEFKDTYETASDPVEQARRTIARSFMGHGSSAIHRKWRTGFRSDSNRSGTTPAHDWRNLPATLPQAIDRLRGVVIENRDAFSVIERFDGPDTLFYVDPPYVLETRSTRHHYRFELDDTEHKRLAELLHKVEGFAVLSGYDCEIYRDSYGDWPKATRRVWADGGIPREETLWMNRKTFEAQTQPELALKEESSPLAFCGGGADPT